MSSQIEPEWLCQWGSGAVGEFKSQEASIPSSLYTLVTPPSPPANVTMGNYALRYNPGGSGLGLASPQLGGAEVASFGFWWRPHTNPSTLNLPVAFLDDGLANGVGIVWKTDLTMQFYDLLGNPLGAASSETFDTAESYGGVTNPWCYIQIQATGRGSGTGAVTYTCRLYKNKADIGSSNPVNNLVLQETISISGQTSGGALVIRLGSSGAASGAWTMANIYVQNGGSQGLFGPIGVSMATALPVSVAFNNTTTRIPGDTGSASSAVTTTTTTLTDTRATWSANQWVNHTVTCNGKTMTITSNTGTTLTGSGWSGGGSPGNGFAWTIAERDNSAAEHTLINEVPPSDSLYPQNYLVRSVPSAGLQRYRMTALRSAGTIPAGANILGVCAKARAYSQGATSEQRFRIAMADSPGSGEEEIFPNLTAITDAWTYQIYASTNTNPLTDVQFVDTDIDNIRLGHEIMAAGSTRRVSQVILTVAWGTDEQAIVPSAEGEGGTTQII